MKKIKKHVIMVPFTIIFVLTICGTVSATDRNVGPGYNYTNITDAVNAASPGDNIYVHDNNGSSYTYNENIIVNKENLSIAAKGNVTVKSKDNHLWYVFGIWASGTTIKGFSNITGAKNFEIETASGICINANNSVVTNNTLSDNYQGISVGDAYNNKISENTIIGNVYSGIFLMGDHFTTISGNTIENNGDGIETLSYDPGKYSDHLEITGNTIKNNQNQGILISINYFAFISTNGATISENKINGNKIGIQVDCSDNNLIVTNTIQNNTNGILLKGSSSNDIARNVINNNSIGISIGEYIGEYMYKSIKLTSFNNTILANNIYNNGDGVSFTSVFTTPSGNHVYCNRIVNNTYWALVNYSDENVDATYNWWGSNNNPSGKIYGSHVKYDPWLVLKAYASPASTYPGGFSTITADLNHGSDGSIAQSNVPNGINILFSANKGSIASPKTTVSGLAKSVLFIPTYVVGTANVSVTVDAQTVNVLVPIQGLKPIKIKIQNLNKWMVHYLYYVKIIAPDGQITTKTFRGNIKDHKLQY